MPLTTMSAGTNASAAAVNANWAICVLTDTSKTITVTHTYTASQTFTGGWTAGAACTVSTGGLTVTAGGLTVSAGTTAVQALTATTGGFTGTVTATVAADGNAFKAIASAGDQVVITPRAAGSGALVSVYNNAGTDFEPLQLHGEQVSLHYRTGVGATATGLTVSSAGVVTSLGISATTGTFSGKVEASGYKTGSGTTTVANGATTTLFAASVAGTYYVTVTVAGSTTIFASGIFLHNGTALTGGGPYNAVSTTATLSNSGTNVQLANADGSSHDYEWRYIRVSLT